MKETQFEWAMKELMKKGQVSRNEALNHFISRLGAIICVLRKDGWVIDGQYTKSRWLFGKQDFVYTLISIPKK